MDEDKFKLIFIIQVIVVFSTARRCYSLQLEGMSSLMTYIDSSGPVFVMCPRAGNFTLLAKTLRMAKTHFYLTFMTGSKRYLSNFLIREINPISADMYRNSKGVLTC